MWNRACPLCFAKVSRSQLLSRSNDLACPACHSPLELSLYSRLLASFVGFLAAVLVFRLPLPHSSANWVLRLVATFLAYGFASALLLFFVADLAVRTNPVSTSFPHTHS
jgi:hypothetical protein